MKNHKETKLKPYLVQIVVESVHEIHVLAENEHEATLLGEDFYEDGGSKAVASEVTKISAQTT